MGGRNWMAGAAIGTVVLTTACGGAATNAVNGEVVLESADNVVGQEDGQEACRGGGGYADIIGGESVVVYNQDGEEVAQTQLELGQPEDGGQVCVFPFAIPELPESDGYAFVVGQRPPAQYTLDELREDDFAVQLAIREE